MCTYLTVKTPVVGGAKGPNGNWLAVTHATVSFDHPVHAMAEHTLNVDLTVPASGPAARVAIELTAASAGNWSMPSRRHLTQHQPNCEQPDWPAVQVLWLIGRCAEDRQPHAPHGLWPLSADAFGYPLGFYCRGDGAGEQADADANHSHVFVDSHAGCGGQTLQPPPTPNPE